MQTALAAPPASYSMRETPLSEKNFRRLSVMVQKVCGIKLTPKKKSMLDGRLRRRMRALNIADINDYCDFLLAGDSRAASDELTFFIDAVTTNKTDFFREPAHFAFLQQKILPAYRAEGRRRIKVWSAAASTGAEAFTIAMVLEDFFHDGGGIDFSILGTDVCTEVLEQARSGIFSDTMLEPIPEDFRRRYVLLPSDPSRRAFRMAAPLRKRITFQQMNLMDDSYGMACDFDLIFLRNVLIYFDRPTQEAVLKKLCRHLTPGGYLFLGHSESLAGSGLPLTMVANTIFRRC